ncbi:hypothetical protein ACQKTA_07195 [Enterococcus sp. 22-H-5-01]|uniref:hypothetical protein n=1 Tax=Enterococcus sp. 22-H-5-01 TaxID=3418555 RepID=UPI003CFFEB31
MAITIVNHFVDYTNEHFDNYLKESKCYQAETGNEPSSTEYKAYFEQGNSLYFHDVLHSVFDLSRKIDLSIEDFEEVLIADGINSSHYILPDSS